MYIVREVQLNCGDFLLSFLKKMSMNVLWGQMAVPTTVAIPLVALSVPAKMAMSCSKTERTA